MGREDVIATKLDILIEDFQEFKKEQKIHNLARMLHATDEDVVQAKILTTQKWHTVIGSFMIGVLMYLIYSHVNVGGQT